MTAPLSQRQRREGLLQARCSKDLEAAMKQIAAFRDCDLSDEIRLACRERVERFKQTFGQPVSANGR